MNDRPVSQRAPWAKRATAFARTYAAEVDRDRLFGLAAETAFFAVLSIFPGLLVVVSLLGLLQELVGADVAAAAQDRVVGLLSLVLTAQASDAVAAVESLFEQKRTGLLSVATVGALVTLSGAFAVTINALNLAYDAAESRPWIRRRLVGLAMALGSLTFAVVALGVVVVGPLFGRGEQLADLLGLGEVFVFVWNFLRLPVLVVALVLWLTLLLRYAPSRRVTWRHALPGALLTAVLWFVASAAFHVYLAIAASRNPLLGAFGGGVIIMSWTYLLSLALLLGGELNAVLHDRRHLDVGPAAPDQCAEQLPLFA